ncbi:MAG TPA: hypothetical protein H9688_08280, partial [Firmicutes bacterium]|nr:hypothetical protein [Bacillota bacterium]
AQKYGIFLGGNEFRLRIKLRKRFVFKYRKDIRTPEAALAKGQSTEQYRKDIRTPQAALAVSQSTDQYPSAHNGLVF